MAPSSHPRPGRTGPIWASRLVRALAGQWGTSGEPTIMRSMGMLIPLTPSGPRDRPDPRSGDRADQVLAWTRSGELSYGDADGLLALDESTPWRGRA